MCTNNSNCPCTDNTCGCKTSTDEVVYQGPPLTCVGINNCDTITEVLQQLNSYVCSAELVTIIINNIINNVSLYQQFTTIVNNSVNCETVWGCETTTTTTTNCPCNVYNISGQRLGGQISYVKCNDIEITTLFVSDIDTFSDCIDNNYPITIIGDIVVSNTFECCPTTTTTTTL